MTTEQLIQRDLDLLKLCAAQDEAIRYQARKDARLYRKQQPRYWQAMGQAAKHALAMEKQQG